MSSYLRWRREGGQRERTYVEEVVLEDSELLLPGHALDELVSQHIVVIHVVQELLQLVFELLLRPVGRAEGRVALLLEVVELCARLVTHAKWRPVWNDLAVRARVS